MSNYANAKDVLPEELFRLVREHFPAGTLYVSDKQERDDSRKQLIVNLAKQNMSAREIAALVGLTVRRVNQVLADRRKRKVEYVWNSNAPAA
jgi:CRP-like cAMP-binding protein